MEEIFKLLAPVNLQKQDGDHINVLNLSEKYTLNQAQKLLLNKGLSFVPSWQTNNFLQEQLKMDLGIYHRKLKLLAYFENKPQKTQIPFKPKSTWSPILQKIPRAIKNIIKKDQDNLDHFKLEKPPPNLTQTEIKALKDLSNKDLIIKPADKGNMVVIQDRFQYLWEANKQLSNQEYCKKLNKPIYQETRPMIKEIIDRLHQKGYITKKQGKYLTGPDEPRPRQFYLLPKIHKNPEEWSWPHRIPPGRPIVSDCSSETYHTAEFIDFFLNPLSIIHPSYIKDTFDFIDKIRKIKIPTEAYLFTMDIKNLYTNIDVQQGLEYKQ